MQGNFFKKRINEERIKQGQERKEWGRNERRRGTLGSTCTEELERRIVGIEIPSRKITNK